MFVRKVKTSGSIIAGLFNILSKQKRFLSRIIYEQKADNMRATEFFLNNLNIPRRTEQYRLSCEDKINSKECAKALATFQHNKAPGNEVIPIEF